MINDVFTIDCNHFPISQLLFFFLWGLYYLIKCLHNESSILHIVLFSSELLKEIRNVHLHIRLCLFVLQACGIDEELRSILKLAKN